jgi:hypothetical protein
MAPFGFADVFDVFAGAGSSGPDPALFWAGVRKKLAARPGAGRKHSGVWAEK